MKRKVIDLKTFWLLRISPDNPDGIFGVLRDGQVPFCVTVENNDYVFPDGDYLCKRVNSPKFGNTFEITGIKGHNHVLFHWGNWEDDSKMCVILGEKFEPVWDSKRNRTKDGVQESKNGGFREFLERTKGIDKFVLKARTIKFPEYPESNWAKYQIEV